MSATEVAERRGSDNTAIRPFEVGFSEEEITELRRRVNATRWRERETVSDDSQGVPLAMMQELARYWGSDYDWQAQVRGETECPTELHHRDRWAGHSFHSRSLPARGRAAADRHARVAWLDH
jgi:hypothetical protein